MKDKTTSPQLDVDALRPLIQTVVAEALAGAEATRSKLDGQAVFTEEEAAEFLRLEPHVLRDERRRGRIRASGIVGRRIRYRREDLDRYLAERTWEKTDRPR